MSGFLREELGVRALLSSMNGWSETLAHQVVRTDFDFVDSHFYWDHPNFLERPWSLPTRGWSSGECAVSAYGSGARNQALVRLLDRPFTISEFNFVAPNEYRAEGGLLTGAVAALQEWDGLYRFTYSHNVGNLDDGGPVGFFDLATDPLTLASDRAGILLFLRGDLRPAEHMVAVGIDPAWTMAEPDRLRDPRSELSRLAYVMRIGTYVGDSDADFVLAGTPGLEAAATGTDAFVPEAPEAVVGAARDLGWLGDDNATDLDAGLLASETGELVLDAKAGTLCIATERSAAVFSREPGGEFTAGPLRVTLDGSAGAVWVAALDGEPLESSRRLLVAHLTDLQNTGIRFRDRRRTILEDWGTTPHLVRAGTAEVALAREDGVRMSAWALALDGRRAGPVAVRQTEDGIALTTDTRGPEGGCFYYELAVD